MQVVRLCGLLGTLSTRTFFRFAIFILYCISNELSFLLTTLTANATENMSSPQEIATAFIQHYYATLGTNPDALAGLYVSAALFVPGRPLEFAFANTNASPAHASATCVHLFPRGQAAHGA